MLLRYYIYDTVTMIYRVPTKYLLQICVQLETKSLGMAHKQREGRSHGCQGSSEKYFGFKCESKIFVARLQSGEMTMVLTVLI